jgi:hypothetical protein
MHVQINNKEWLLSYLIYCEAVSRYHSWTVYISLERKLNWIGNNYPIWISLWNEYWMSKSLPRTTMFNRIEWKFYLKNIPDDEDF